MKIIQLRFKNLNSLAGEWSIDFTAPEYVADGIFAISGPTGAGKSTILDAICLALYGRTPRLPVISKSTNEIMSRQTGVCFSEVVFETGQGRFRAFWSQKRAREKAGGALQTPVHELSHADSGVVIASQLRTTASEIEKNTGMDYDRFVQSMMLAQGGFAAFLQAGGNERAPILEQITGTEIYSRISVFVHEQQKSEKARLAELEAGMSGIRLLGDTEEEEIRQALAGIEPQITELNSEATKLETAVNWLKGMEKLRADLQQMAADEEALTIDRDAFEPKRKRLADALRAASLEADYKQLVFLRKQQKDDLDSLTKLREATPALEAEKSAAQEAARKADEQREAVNTAREALLKVTREVSILDREIARLNAGRKDLQEAIDKLSQGKQAKADEKTKLLLETAKKFKEWETLRKWLEENQRDAALISEYAGIRQAAIGYVDLLRNLEKAEKNEKILINSLKDLKEESRRKADILVKAQKTFSGSSAEVDKAKSGLAEILQGKTTEEWMQRRDYLVLFLADMKKIADLQTERSLLRDNQPCPLCGSLHHPYAEGNIPVAREQETELENILKLLEKAGEENKKLEKLHKYESDARDQLTRAEGEWNRVAGQVSDVEKQIGMQVADTKERQEAVTKAAVSLSDGLSPFGITAIPVSEAGFVPLMKELKDRKELYEYNHSKADALKQEIQERQGQVKVFDTEIEGFDRSISEKGTEMTQYADKLPELITQRHAMFGEKIVAEEEVRAARQLQAADREKEAAAGKLLEKSRQLDDNLTKVNSLNSRIQNNQPVLESKETQFKEQLQAKGFMDEPEYLACSLPEAEREKLSAEARSLDSRVNELAIRRKERTEALQLEEAKQLTLEDKDALKAKLEETVNLRNARLQEQGALRQKLEDNEKAREQVAGIAGKIAAQKAVYERWAKLSGLIGSADGKKYRNFAQGLTLEVMVSFANAQLVKLSDRYLLVRDREDPLDLNVIDNYQAGEIRSTKNLSGGESFIVSLALALGLSRMSSRNVRVDSLFLDEGFGTLDEETLETALGTLASLRQDGKMIGVISHVGALKERISTRIVVSPVREGRSVISGPGVF
jgi:DNA repair protein SbcC/Rad50